MPSIQDLTKNELLLLLELQHYCLQAGSGQQDIEQLFAVLGRLVPFERAIVSFNVESSEQRNEKQFGNVGFPAEWLQQHAKRGFERIDPVFAESKQNPKPFTYATAIGNTPWKVEQFVNMAADFGVVDGICCGLNLAGKTGDNIPFSLLVNVASSRSDFDEVHLSVLEHVTPHLFEMLNHQGEIRDIAMQVPRLTKTELEVLKWCQQGKSSWEIGQITNRSERTIKFHLSNVFRKLNVSSRTHAVAKATRVGLI